ncbi:MAG: glutathione-disulfide reductase [Nevskia sp.]
MSDDYDLLVLGGGSGGVAAARRAAQHGARVALIESDRLGGTCVNVGCVPKKLMWNAAHIAETLHEAGGYGFDIPAFTHDWPRLRARREAYIARLNGIYRENLDSHHVTLVEGRGRLVSRHEIDVGGRRLRGERLLIAAGGQPQRPDIPGAALGIDSNGFFALDHCPRRVVVVGAGYIAVELAGMLQALGAEVTLIVRGPRLLTHFDAMLGEALLAALQAQGVVVRLGAQVAQLDRGDGGMLSATLASGDALATDCLLWATGRRANSEGIGLREAGVALDQDGHILVDDWQATSVDNIYAIGDITGRVALTPVAIAAGRRLSDRLYNAQPDRRLDYTNVPSVVFSHPPVGTVGLTEAAARAQHGEAAVKIYESRFKALYYGVLDIKRETRMKLVCVGPEERIVGLHAIGEGVDELLQGFAVAVKMGATKRDFDDTVAIHPTSAEEFVTMK